MDIERQRVFGQCDSWGETRVLKILSDPTPFNLHDHDLMREWLRDKTESRRQAEVELMKRSVAASERQLSIGRWALILSGLATIIAVIALVRSW